jgi:hypothetical protein
MVRNIFFGALAVTAIAGIGYANQPAPSKVVISVSRTQASSGKQMYASYCALVMEWMEEDVARLPRR